MNIEGQEIKDLDNLQPVDYGVVAKPHTPIYKMHRYFARRPYTVFRELIEHYSNPGSTILDPMCGGGVTIVEGLKLRRKVIGIDLNPMAIFITRCEVMDVDLEKVKGAFYEISEKIKEEINSLYLTKCPKCKKETPADWFEWSAVAECPNCKKSVIFAETRKVGPGKYNCPYCKYPIKSLKTKRKSDRIVRVKLKCEHCNFKGEKKPDAYDFEQYKQIGNNFDKIVKDKNLWYPDDRIFLGEKTRELLTKGYRNFYELFTKRNLIGLATLRKEISKIPEGNVRDLFILVFSSTIDYSTKISRVVQGAGREITMHAYWVPDLPCENNVWHSFFNRYLSMKKGKEESRTEIGNYYNGAKTFEALAENCTCWLMSKSATDLSGIPDKSIDVIITDPPYGANVNYTELSDLWTIWLKGLLPFGGILNSEKEAIINKYQGKNYKEYRNLMAEIFKECYRVLKPGRYMVMTFHNREFKVWSAIHLASHDAGFMWLEKDGMVYQPPIRQYFTAGMLHGRAAGAMKGDFVLSYKKEEKPPEEKWIDEAEVGNKIKKLASQSIEYHGGAKLSTIYMHAMPFLLNSGLLDKIKENELEKYLGKYFVKKGQKWYFKEHIDGKTGNLVDKKIEEFAPVKARLESIIRRYLYQVGKATTDEILGVIYSRLINSNAAEYEEIVHVLNRICTPPKGARREGEKHLWQLKEEKDRELLLGFLDKEKRKVKYTEESDHDIIIEKLVKIGERNDFGSHIGTTEQKKDKEFRRISIPMGNNVQYGLSDIAFDRVREIDVLWLKANTITAAFEVEISTSIDSGINRFRELFAATPTLNIPTYIVIPDNRENEAKKKIGSLANRREGITDKVKYVLYSEIVKAEDKDIEGIARKVK